MSNSVFHSADKNTFRMQKEKISSLWFDFIVIVIYLNEYVSKGYNNSLEKKLFSVFWLFNFVYGNIFLSKYFS